MKRTRSELKLLFQTGDKPTEQDFADWLDSFLHIDEYDEPNPQLNYMVGVDLLGPNDEDFGRNWGIKNISIKSNSDMNSPIKTDIDTIEKLDPEGNPIQVNTLKVVFNSGDPDAYNVIPLKPTSAGKIGTLIVSDQYLYLCVKSGDSPNAQWIRLPVDTLSVGQTSWENSPEMEENQISIVEKHSLLAI